MKQKKIAGLFVTALLFTACQKENISPAKDSSVGTSITGVLKRAPKHEGIKSFDYYDQFTNSASIGYYVMPLPIQGASSLVALLAPADNAVLAYGATTTGEEAIAYREVNTSGSMRLSSTTYGDIPITLNTPAPNTPFTYIIEEIEIMPATMQVYALVQSGLNKVIYLIDMSTGVATPLGTVFTRTNTKGYKSGSIAFVPDGSGSYELVFTHEYSNAVSTSGTISSHYTISGTMLSINSTTSKLYSLLPGTGDINTTYGNGKLYFARNGNGTNYGTTNPAYSLSQTANTYASEGFSVMNINDFGYWKEL